MSDVHDEVSNERLRALGSAVADVSDRASSIEGLERPDGGFASIRQAFLTRVSPSSSSSRAGSLGRGRVLGAVGGLAAAAALIVGAHALWESARDGRRSGDARSDASLSFTVASDDGDVASTGAGDQPGVVGQWVAARPAAKREAHFSDGSELALAPGARMRVTTTTPAGAEVLIEQGSVHMAVKHREASDRADGGTGSGSATRWAVRAGPFEVRVTGTTFDAAWDPAAERFDLTMIEGRVLVSGPSLPPDRAVVAGEHLLVSVRDGRMVLAREGEPGVEPRRDVSAAAGGVAGPALKPVQVPSVAPAARDWRELASAGKYADALALAESAGFSQEVQRASLGDLWALADVARYAGSAARAKEALLAARSRFGARGQSAFLLGKIAADQQGSPGEAISWFETYLAEQPGAPLAEQALGRVVDLTRRVRPDAAPSVAARYLARYPRGSYAALALSLGEPRKAPPADATDGGLVPSSPP